MITKTKLKVGHKYKVKKMAPWANDSNLSEKIIWIKKLYIGRSYQKFYFKNNSGIEHEYLVNTSDIPTLGLKDISTPALSLFIV